MDCSPRHMSSKAEPLLSEEFSAVPFPYAAYPEMAHGGKLAQDAPHPPAIAGESRFRSAYGPAHAGLMPSEKQREITERGRKMGGDVEDQQASGLEFDLVGEGRQSACRLTGMRSLDARMP